LVAGRGDENEKWFTIQDLIVEETRKEMIFLGETILQVRVFIFNHDSSSHISLRSGNVERRGLEIFTIQSATSSSLGDFRHEQSKSEHIEIHATSCGVFSAELIVLLFVMSVF